MAQLNNIALRVPGLSEKKIIIDGRNEKPIALDLFCGGGGAGVGLYMAGYDVIGVDINCQHEYPFTFIQADATKINNLFNLNAFDLVWASPMCQKHSTLNNVLKKDYPCQIEPVRKMLIGAGVKYIFENVPAAPLFDPVSLTGDMFGLSIIRRRKFESNVSLSVPLHFPERGRVKSGKCFTVAGSGGGNSGSIQQCRDAMGIDWMKRKTLVQAVPPAYAWYLARQIIKPSMMHGECS